MWDIKSFSTAPQCSRAKTEKARGGEERKKRYDKETEWARVSPVKGGEKEMTKGNWYCFELIKYFSEGGGGEGH